ncbi:MAG TPA: xanthine dehydrogenase family protein subunit M, partial [Nitrososphaerales archaeon]|nr:xanthine dehydrogenase family protein subunit M [Nitrososphaerales archaeon]
SRLIAGGTALVIMLKEGILTPSKLIDISEIESMRKISYDERNGLSIGSMSTHLEIENSEAVAKHYPALREAFHTIGNVRIRAVGTIGGNLAYAEPQCNPPAILAALSATIHARGKNGKREIPAEGFIKGIFESALESGEIITSISIPPPRPRSAVTFYKFTTKSETDKPTATVAVYLESEERSEKITECRIVVGAVGPVTSRCKNAENLVKKAQNFSSIDYSDVAEAASEEIEVMDDLYGPSWYKKQVTKSILIDSLKQAVEKIENESQLR